jgi:hypothetical protein
MELSGLLFMPLMPFFAEMAFAIAISVVELLLACCCGWLRVVSIGRSWCWDVLRRRGMLRDYLGLGFYRVVCCLEQCFVYCCGVGGLFGEFRGRLLVCCVLLSLWGFVVNCIC